VSKAPAIYSITETERRGQLLIEPTWVQNGDGPLRPGYAHFSAINIGGQAHLLAVADGGEASLFTLTGGKPQAVDAPLSFGHAVDAVDSFVLGDETYVYTYVAKDGMLRFHRLRDRSLSQPFEYFRARQPGITVGWTTVKAFTYQRALHICGYGYETGEVILLKVAVTPTSEGGAPPLDVETTWSWTWAKGWTRFAFFQIGGENFFLKTNLLKPNVNIDHLSDDPGRRSSEIGTHLTLADAATLTSCDPFLLADGHPGFTTCRPDGHITFNRVHPDCRGWTTEATLEAAFGPTHLVHWRTSNRAFVLVY